MGIFVQQTSDQLDILALIPARGGSKGIPGKNLYPIMGKPLIQYTIEAAIGCEQVQRVMLSTEDEHIRQFVANFPVMTDYQRPPHLATDTASTVDVVLDVLDWLEHQQALPDVLMLLQPTSPLRTHHVIEQAIATFKLAGTHSLVGVHAMKEHPFKSIVRATQGWHYLARSATMSSNRRQDYPDDYFVINGSMYMVTPRWLRHKGQFVVEGETTLFETTPMVGLDVDALMDIYQVEAYLKQERYRQHDETNH